MGKVRLLLLVVALLGIGGTLGFDYYLYLQQQKISDVVSSISSIQHDQIDAYMQTDNVDILPNTGSGLNTWSCNNNSEGYTKCFTGNTIYKCGQIHGSGDGELHLGWYYVTTCQSPNFNCVQVDINNAKCKGNQPQPTKSTPTRAPSKCTQTCVNSGTCTGTVVDGTCSSGKECCNKSAI